jgi:Holliday junction resolvasome RuvABC endonuclease subunit
LRILGLDPGEATGHATIVITGEDVEISDYGIISIAGEGRRGLVTSVSRWLRDTRDTSVQEAAFSEIVQMPKLPTSHAAVEVQGVIRASGAVGYSPSTVHSRLRTKNKASVKQLVQRVIGRKLPGATDHVYDAAGAALCHAVILGLWTLPGSLCLPEPPKRRPGGRKLGTTDPNQLKGQNLADLMRRGEVRVRK